MTTRSGLTTDNKAIDRQIAFLQAIPEMLHDDVLDIAAEMEDEILSDVAFEPGPRGDDKMIWSLDKTKDQRARNWWFAHLDSIPTDGRHYIRQGTGTARGFKVEVDREGSVIGITIRSTWDKARFVFGLLRRDNFDTRIPGHKTTGWEAAQPKIEYWFGEINKRLLKRLNERLSGKSRFGRPR